MAQTFLIRRDIKLTFPSVCRFRIYLVVSAGYQVAIQHKWLLHRSLANFYRERQALEHREALFASASAEHLDTGAFAGA